MEFRPKQKSNHLSRKEAMQNMPKLKEYVKSMEKDTIADDVKELIDKHYAKVRAERELFWTTKDIYI